MNQKINVWHSGGGNHIVLIDNPETKQSLSFTDEVLYICDIPSSDFWDIEEPDDQEIHILGKHFFGANIQGLMDLCHRYGFDWEEVVAQYNETFNPSSGKADSEF